MTGYFQYVGAYCTATPIIGVETRANRATRGILHGARWNFGSPDRLSCSVFTALPRNGIASKRCARWLTRRLKIKRYAHAIMYVYVLFPSSDCSTDCTVALFSSWVYYLYYKKEDGPAVSQSVRPSADISALKEISRNLGNHWCSQFLFSIFFARFEHKNFELWEDI